MLHSKIADRCLTGEIASAVILRFFPLPSVFDRFCKAAG
jgi:hypothetical protein